MNFSTNLFILRIQPLFLHAFYWIGAVLLFLFFFTLIGPLKLGAFYALVNFPLIIGLVYLFIYWAIPTFLFKGKQTLFILISVALFLAVLNIQFFFVSSTLFYPGSDGFSQIIDNIHWVFFFLITSTLLLTLPAILYESIRFWNQAHAEIEELYRNERQPNYLEVKINGKDHLIDIQKITYIESFKDHAHIHLQGQKIITRMTLKKINELIPEFLRVHRSFIVNPEYCQALNSDEVILSGFKIPLGGTYKDDVLNVLKPGGK